MVLRQMGDSGQRAPEHSTGDRGTVALVTDGNSTESLVSGKRERQHLTNAGGAGKHHQQAFNTDSDTARRRHGVFERAQEIGVELHRFRVASGGQQGLLGQSRSLLHRVDEFGVAGAEFAAEDDEIPALGEARIGAVLAYQRRHLDGKVPVEGGFDGLALDQLLVQLEQDLAAVPLRLEGDVRLVRRAGAARSGRYRW